MRTLTGGTSETLPRTRLARRTLPATAHWPVNGWQMSTSGARNALITSALVVAGIRMWMQLRGKTKTPFNEWAIGWGATFFILALLSEAAPTAAGSLSVVIVASDFLVNGVSLTNDISAAVTGTEGSQGTTFVQQPFAAQSTTQAPATGKVAG